LSMAWFISLSFLSLFVGGAKPSPGFCCPEVTLGGGAGQYTVRGTGLGVPGFLRGPEGLTRQGA
jgi:hypothetical protein